MDNLRIEFDDRSRKERRRTLAQRKLITGSLRDGYDMAKPTNPNDEDFAVYMHTSTLPTPLTKLNERYLSGEAGYEQLNQLFGKLAVNTTVEIDKVDDDYIVSLLHTH